MGRHLRREEMDAALDEWEGLVQEVSVQPQPAEVRVVAILRLPSGFRLRRVTCTPHDPWLRRPRVKWRPRAGQSRWARTPALFDPQLVADWTPARARAVQDIDFDTLDQALQASLPGPWVDAKTFFDDINRQSGQDSGGDFGGDFGGDGGE